MELGTLGQLLPTDSEDKVGAQVKETWKRLVDALAASEYKGEVQGDKPMVPAHDKPSGER